ncbi:hypothetical protein LC612_01370 [Nostoc sp. CHAB 5834]|nr:hypothetical protein [Nostoc sp. CHAB 5834]
MINQEYFVLLRERKQLNFGENWEWGMGNGEWGMNSALCPMPYAPTTQY